MRVDSFDHDNINDRIVAIFLLDVNPRICASLHLCVQARKGSSDISSSSSSLFVSGCDGGIDLPGAFDRMRHENSSGRFGRFFMDAFESHEVMSACQGWNPTGLQHSVELRISVTLARERESGECGFRSTSSRSTILYPRNFDIYFAAPKEPGKE